ncbi:MAG TPA: hypothetical protein PLE10_07450 [Brevefilum sp.]|nr:hypothetical protein [Brevefilum sp.]HPL70053.1 hypothetical protein [Brevefilum sp.]
MIFQRREHDSQLCTKADPDLHTLRKDYPAEIWLIVDIEERADL